MAITRRSFIKITGATAAGVAVSRLGFDLKPVTLDGGVLYRFGSRRSP